MHHLTVVTGAPARASTLRCTGAGLVECVRVTSELNEQVDVFCVRIVLSKFDAT